MVTDFSIRRLDSRGDEPDNRLAALEEFGRDLFAKLFAGKVAEVFEHLREDADFLEVHLRFAESAASLESIPWETLHDGSEFLAAGLRSTILRLPVEVTGDRTSAELRCPVRMLGVLSSPLDLEPAERLNIEQEQSILLEAVDVPASCGVLHLELEDEAKLPILRALLAQRFDLLHFTGHGLSPERGGGGLLLEDASGRKRPTGADELVEVFDPARTGLQLVVLATCLSARSSTVGDVHSLLRRLSRSGVPHVVAMGFPVLDVSGLAFAEWFYSELFSGAPFARVLHHTRRALLSHDNHDIRPDALAIVYQGSGAHFLTPELSAPARSEAHAPSRRDTTARSDVFYGRRREGRRLRDELSDRHRRAVCIHGMGGVGKTSLVRHVLGRLESRFTILHIDAAEGEASPELVVLRLHRLLGDQGALDLEQVVHGMPDPAERVAAVRGALRRNPTLVVLDNFEALLLPPPAPGQRHVPAAVDVDHLLSGLLAGDIGDSKLVFLSRHPFTLAGGTVGVAEIHLEDLSWPEAIALMQAQPGLSALSREQKRQVYVSFGGNPLALLLLDRRCRAKPGEDLPLLLGHVRLEARQHAAIALNYDSVSPASAGLLVSLAAFHERFPRAFAAWLAADVSEEALGSELQELEQWGLLGTAAEEHFLMVHPLVREFCRDRTEPGVWRQRLLGAAQCLAQASELADHPADAAGGVMAAYELLREAAEFELAAELLIEHHPQLHRIGLGWRLEIEYNDLLARVPPETQRWIRLERAVLLQWRGELGAALQELEVLQQEAIAIGHRQMEMSTHHQIARVQQERGQVDKALAGYREALRVARELRDRTQMSRTLHQLGAALQVQGLTAEARAAYEESLQLKTEAGDVAGAARTLHQLASILQSERRFDEALELYHGALSAKETVGDRQGIAHTLHQIGVIHFDRGELERALNYLERAHAIIEALNAPADLSRSLIDIARVYRAADQIDKAVREYRKAFRIADEIGHHAWADSVLLELAQLCRSSKRWPEAHDAFEQLLPRLIARRAHEHLALAKLSLGHVEEALGRRERAVVLYREILATDEVRGLDIYGVAQNRLAHIAEEEGRLEEAGELFAESVMGLGCIALQKGRLQEATKHFRRAQAMGLAAGDGAATALADRMLSQTLLRAGDIDHAAQACERAIAAYERLGDASNVGKCRHLRGIVLFESGDHAGALTEYQEALSAAEASEDTHDVARVLHQIGVLHQLDKANDEASSCFKRSLAIARELQDHEQISASLHHLGHLLDDEERYAEALELYEESMEVKRRHGLRAVMGVSLFAISKMHLMLGNLERALRPMIEARTLAAEIGTIDEAGIRDAIRFLRNRMGRESFSDAWRSFTGTDPPAEFR